jgi:hypothetical protein
MNDMLAVVAAGSPLAPVIIILALVTIIVACIAAVLILGWKEAPWWRSTASPRRMIKDARYRIKVYKMQKRHPEAFVTPLPENDSVTLDKEDS